MLFGVPARREAGQLQDMVRRCRRHWPSGCFRAMYSQQDRHNRGGAAWADGCWGCGELGVTAQLSLTLV
jgi:hypothetical protein